MSSEVKITSKRPRRRLCSVKGCYNTSDSKKDVMFFPFPRQSQLKEEWIKFCNDENLYTVSEKTVKQRYVCSAHFARSCINNNAIRGPHVICGSVPTIYVPYSSNDIRLLKETFQLKSRESCNKVTLSKQVNHSPSIENKVKSNLLSDESKIGSTNSYSKQDNTFIKCYRSESNTTECNFVNDDEISTDKSNAHLLTSHDNTTHCQQDHKLLDSSVLLDEIITNPLKIKELVVCSMKNCQANTIKNPDFIFFPFPSRETDYDRFKKWVEFSRNQRLILRNANETFFLCSIHFEDSEFNSSDKIRLIPDACPTLTCYENENNETVTPMKAQDVSVDVTEFLQKESDLKIISVHSLAENNNACDNSISTRTTLSTNCENVENSETEIEVSVNNTDNTNNEIIELSEANKAHIQEEYNGQFDAAKLRKYKFIVTIVKDIDERKDISLLTVLIINKVEKLIDNLINKMPIVNDDILMTSATETDISDETNNSYSINEVTSKGCQEKKEEKVKLKEKCTSHTTPVTVKENSKNSSSKNDHFATANKMYCLDNSNLCSCCGFLAKTVSRLNHHIKLHHEEQICVICDKTLPDLIEYRKHLKKHKRKKRPSKRKLVDKTRKYYCDLCEINCLNSAKFARHNLIIHNIGNYYTCDVCNKTFVTKYKLLYHKEAMHMKTEEQIAFVCQYCGQTFKRHSNYFAHIKFIHLDQFKHFCTICNKRLRSPTALYIHMTNHINGANKEEHDAAISFIYTSFGKRLKCLVCNVKFTNSDIETFKQHMEYHANDDEIKNLVGNSEGKFECAACKKNFPNIGKLALHRYYFHEDVPFICGRDGCKLTFWSNWDLVLHQKTLHVKRDFTCKICLENFHSIQKKLQHMKISHPKNKSSEKSFPCKICGKSFTMSCHLKMHMVVHTGVKSYKCDVCNKVIKTAGAFKLHKRSHDRREMHSSKVVTVQRTKEQQENINRIFNDIGQQMEEEMVAVENIDQLGVALEEEIIGIIDYSQF